MRQEVLEFYEAHNIPVDRLVRAGARRGLSGADIRRAAEEVYDAVQNGAEIRPIRLAWVVYGRCQKVATKEERQERYQKELGSVGDAIRELSGQLAEHMTPWHKKLWRRFNAECQ